MHAITVARSLTTAVFAALALIVSPSLAQPAPANWSAVDQALGRTGATQPDGVRRYGFPRSDLHVVIDDVTVKPALALGGWLAFQSMGNTAAVMGDLVLAPDEVKPVMGELIRGGIRVTAVHNHLLRSSVPIVYMHVMGRGNAPTLAHALHAGLALSHTPLAASAPPAPASPLEMDTAAIDQIMGRAGKANGGVYQFTFPRAERIVEGGMAVPASMGTGTGINFQPVGSGRAAVTGDFVLLASEVDPVMRELSNHGIEITALHSHMIGEQPTLYFMHFWAVAPAVELARSLRAAVNRTNVQR